jgi:hypothetical protein
MPLRVQLRIVSDDDTVIRDEVILRIDKSDDRLEAIGLCPPVSPAHLCRRHAENLAGEVVSDR